MGTWDAYRGESDGRSETRYPWTVWVEHQVYWVAMSHLLYSLSTLALYAEKCSVGCLLLAEVSPYHILGLSNEAGTVLTSCVTSWTLLYGARHCISGTVQTSCVTFWTLLYGVPISGTVLTSCVTSWTLLYSAPHCISGRASVIAETRAATRTASQKHPSIHTQTQTQGRLIYCNFSNNSINYSKTLRLISVYIYIQLCIPTHTPFEYFTHN